MLFVHYTEQKTFELPTVHLDDSIDLVWFKIAEHLKCSIQDVYLFTKKKVSLTPEKVYEMLIAETGDIPWFYYMNFLHNLNRPVSEIRGKIKLETIADLSYENVLMDVSIGQTMLISANPYLATYISEFGSTPLYKQQSFKLLLDYMPFYQDTIYVCLKKDFPKMDMYFQHDVNLDYVQRRLSGMEDIFSLPKSIPTIQIQSMLCELYPDYTLNIPLDTIFNILHTSEQAPMIQYNSGSEDTILYKLYSTQEDILGNKIPLLKPNEIVKKNQTPLKSVAVFFNDHTKYVFKEDGSVLFDIKCKHDPCTMENIQDLVHKHKDVYDMVATFMYKSGYKYPQMTSIDKMKILDIVVRFQYTDVPSFQDHNCRHKFFITLGVSEKRYIRVSDFDESKLIYEICLSLFLNEIPLDKIKRNIQEIFSMSDQQSEKVLLNFRANLEVLESRNENKKLSIREREGFPTLIDIHQNIASITVSGINSIYYLPEIERNLSAYISLCTIPNRITCLKQVVVEYKEQELATELESDEELEFSEEEGEALEFETMEGQEGGAPHDPDLILKNQSFLITRIKTAMGNKYVEEFTRLCPLTRCPVALKKGEQTNPYVSKHDQLELNGFVYICPAYWDMQNKIPLSEEDLQKDPHRQKKIIDKKSAAKRSIDFEVDGTVLPLNTKGYPYPNMLDNEKGPCCFKIKRDKGKKEPKKINEAIQRIIEDRTRPIEETKVARLPKSIQYFFGLPESCMLEKDNYLLRYGVAPPSSFIDCIVACILFSYSKHGYTREWVLAQLIATTRRGFSKYNNGRLAQQFTLEEFVKNIELMDYTYLWEIVCDTFPLNLVILRVPSENDVEIVCPSPKYMKAAMNPEKSIFILLERHKKKEITFEPIVEHDTGKYKHVMMHSYDHPKLNPIFKIIEQHYQECKPFSEYYTTNVSADKMYPFLTGASQVLHNNMCIGFSVKGVFIPCYPSAKLDIKAVPMPESSYAKTKEVLSEVPEECVCRPRFKVVHQNKIYGIITQTNSFVPCIPEEDMEDELSIYQNVVQYEYMPISPKQDVERILSFKNTELEKYCYMAFRRVVKELVNKNKGLRTRLNKLIRHKEVSEDTVKELLNDQYRIVMMNERLQNEIIQCKGMCHDELIIPEMNAVSGRRNNYFKRMASELNRYPRISSFIIHPQLYIPDTPFSLHDHELMLIGYSVESYLNDLSEPKRGPISYDTVAPYRSKQVSELVVKKIISIKL
jgi:hypothetical protein